MNDPQRTLQSTVRCGGIALHTGFRAHVSLGPAPANSGIVIVRSDLPGRPTIPAHVRQVVDVRRATTIAAGPAKVHTVEHVLAALYGCGIDNAVVEMDGPEPPVMDGSSAAFVDLIAQAGTVIQDQPRAVYRITAPLYVEQGDTRLIALPDERYRMACTVQFGVSVLDTQYRSLVLGEGTFAAELCQARTFCRYDEIEQLMVAGLIRGGSLDNSVILKDNAIISKDGLRYPDELVRHKILDMVGDLSLVGCRILGQIIAIKPGHPANVALARKIVEQMAAAAPVTPAVAAC